MPEPISESVPEPGTEIELEISTVAHGGVFVARTAGRVVFVGDAIPGERVLARLTETRHARFWRAETVRVLQASPFRRDHVWRAASLERDPDDRAGGAEFGHIAPGHQRELKAQVAGDALHRMAGIDLPVVVQPAPGDEPACGLRWRTRVRLHVDDQGRVGPYAGRSHRVVAVADLPLAVEGVEAAAPLAERMPGARQLDIVAPASGPVRTVVRQASGRPAGCGPGNVTERVGEREFRVAVDGFWQVHRGAPLVLTQAVQRAIDGARFDPAADNLDLYGGVGLLAAAVADRFGPATRVTSVESARAATAAAGGNLAEWPHARALTARADRFLADRSRHAGAAERDRLRAATVVLDPPRSGAGAEVVDQLLALHPAQLVYVACDPVAFARDAALLSAGGYWLDVLEAFDLFPHTHHVELVARFLPA